MRSFENFLRAASSSVTDSATLQMLCDDVCKKEDTADKTLRKMIDSLVGTSFLPSSREDIIAIATSCDKVAELSTSNKVIASTEEVLAAIKNGTAETLRPSAVSPWR